MRFLILIVVLSVISCSDPSASHGTERKNEVAKGQLSNGELQAIAEAKKALPEHAKYVDQRGKFNVRKAAKVLWETGNYDSPSQAVTRANEMELEWLQEIGARMDEIA